MKPKLLILFAGGTIGMVHNPTTNALEPAQSALELLQNIPELNDIADIDFELIVNLDSSNMTPEHWVMIAKKIHEQYNMYDGFVVAQGTDTMAYTASALSFALGNLGKPVIFTGSLIPLREAGSDARNNLVYACMTATLDIAEVCIVLSHTILRGNRAKKHHESFVAAFHSPNFPVLGELGRPIVLNNWRVHRHEGNLTLNASFESNIAVVKLFPGFNPEYINLLLNSGVRAIVIEGFGPGNVPFLNQSVIPGIEIAVSHNIPVIITSQMEQGKTNLQAYQAGLKALNAGAISAKDMTIEATITKTMWALPMSQNSGKSVELLIKTNVAGELSV
ncbi:MAG: L-asparaginase I [Candidatus Uhrbacteria bacterium GW2011_GWA2_53_10]|uniref:L-asparaginase I n=1 Tax=Candidatus Uhrbacteria bacterium GW2011_GWA2_53_10 TaxID=1618980 RepID=A0A0G1XNK7_9BACT|nr:MAG: L-asparaginase I [Candidatus Uhrbacteria bacterium GW2011_GWA2_53_10]